MFKHPDELDMECPPELFAAVRKAGESIADRGLHVSAGSWVDVEGMSACIFSRECYGPGTYNAPKHTIAVNVRPVSPIAEDDAV